MEVQETGEFAGIRRAAEADIPALCGLYDWARDFMRRSGNPSQWNGTYPGPADIRRDMENGVLWMEDAAQAVMALIPGPDPTYETIDGAWPDQAPYWVIHRIAARPGYGRRMIRFAKQHCGRIRIDTHEDNKPMQRLLTKEGFEYCGIITCASGSPRGAWIWRRD